MRELKKVLYKITALSNLHVGSGDQNYGIVDKLVQRDPISGFPVIHSSSLKGALKVYCEEVLDLNKNKDPMISSFGKGDSPGFDKYFSAHLFTLPVRSNQIPFYRATCPAILKEVILQLESFGLSTNPFAAGIMELFEKVKDQSKPFSLFNEINNLIIEEYEIDPTSYHPLFQNEVSKNLANIGFEPHSFVVIRDDIFMEICENLPVIARNRLDEQKNLWYEEVVPRQSEFYFIYLGKEDNKTKLMEPIVNKSKNDFPVQIGANASVGYGFCKIEEIAAA